MSNVETQTLADGAGCRRTATEVVDVYPDICLTAPPGRPLPIQVVWFRSVGGGRSYDAALAGRREPMPYLESGSVRCMDD